MDPAVQTALVSINPATGAVLGEYPITGCAEVEGAVAAARKEQPSWAARDVRQRIGIVRRFIHLLCDAKDDVSRLITEESGKPLGEALTTEVLVTLDAAEFCASHAVQLLREERIGHRNPALKTKRGRLIHEPHGVIGIISPWNYPFAIPSTETLAALVLGNTVVLKPSELTPGCAIRLRDLLHQAGVPKDAFQVVTGAAETGVALVQSAVDKLVFTGSVRTGKRIAALAAERLLPVVLELGGKDAMIVLDDADIDLASSAAVWGAFVNAGQACLSVERCLVHRSIYERFVGACVKKTGELRVGNGADPHTDVGPMINQRQLQAVEDHVADALAQGAKVLCGGRRLPGLGPNFYAPAVLTGISREMKIMREETFGPVLPILPFENDEEAVSLANDSDFALSASLWTRERHRGELLARRLSAGAVMVNDVISCFGSPEAPHGGWKMSGLGRTHGLAGMREMLRVRYLDSERVALKKPWWYGYTDDFFRQMSGFVDFLFSRSWTARVRGLWRSSGLLFRRRL